MAGILKTLLTYLLAFVADSNKKVPVNLKVYDAFHLTIEEYLLALVSLIEDLACYSPTTSQSTV